MKEQQAAPQPRKNDKIAAMMRRNHNNSYKVVKSSTSGTPFRPGAHAKTSVTFEDSNSEQNKRKCEPVSSLNHAFSENQKFDTCMKRSRREAKVRSEVRNPCTC